MAPKAGGEPCQRALTQKRTLSGGGVLDCLDSAVLRQIEREQLRVRSVEASAMEVDVRLPGLDATERHDLRHLKGGGHNSIRAFAELVVEQTAMRGR